MRKLLLHAAVLGLAYADLPQTIKLQGFVRDFRYPILSVTYIQILFQLCAYLVACTQTLNLQFLHARSKPAYWVMS